jgi:hypothetical protein
MKLKHITYGYFFSMTMLAVFCIIILCLTGCGTVVNSSVAAYEKNTATNAIQAEVNIANAATFAVLNTPVYVLPFMQANQRACIADLSATDSSKQLTNIINATAPAVPVPATAPAK